MRVDPLHNPFADAPSPLQPVSNVPQKLADALAESELDHIENAPERDAAQDAGIAWERPEDDTRSAAEIVKDSKLLSQLGNQSGVKDMLRERVGDFDTDADAAYRAVQVLEHVERFDADGDRIASKDIGNGRINGFTNSGEARNGTEAGRLQDFGKYGFEDLKGDFGNAGPSGAPTNGEADREKAEIMGIAWERADDDTRSAADIMNDSALLKNLGNQSGVKEMLRDRVGDFESDADAAYRAVQVLDRIVSYDENGKMRTGGQVSDDRINGFTNSGEARHGTEAGRLQDFGKYGFDTFREESSRFRDFKDANPDADAATTRLYRYADLLGQNYDAIRERTGAEGNLTAGDIRDFRETNPNLSDDFKDALDFWSQDSMFAQLENAQKPLTRDLDGQLSEGDIQAWLDQPKDLQGTLDLLHSAADVRLHANVDTSDLGYDIFENPGDYSVEEKAAVLHELQRAQSLISTGAESGMWRDDQSMVAIANKVNGHPDPERLMADLNGRIAELQGDADVIEYLKESRADAMKEILDGDPRFAEELRSTYVDRYKSGDALDTLWAAGKGTDDVEQQAVLAEFVANAQSLQDALGMERPEEIQKAVQASSHYGEIEAYYEDNLVSGDRYASLLEDGDFTSATSAFTSEVALYGSVIDKTTVDANQGKLDESFNRIARENILKDSSFDDLKSVYGVDGGEELDVSKVEEMLEKVAQENPDLMMGEGALATSPAQIVTAMRGAWDMMRQGTKVANVFDALSENSQLKGAFTTGALHGMSGLLLGGAAIANGAALGGQPTEAQITAITAGSIQTAAILGEGGMKNYVQTLKGQDVTLENILKEDPNLVSRMQRLERGLGAVGGIAGAAAGAVGIVTGVEALRNGDEVTAGLTMTGGALAAMAGVAGTVEAGMGIFAGAAPRIVASIAGGLGFTAAGVGAVVSLIPGLIEEIRQADRVDDFANILSDTLLKYEIDGVPYGDQWDIPDSEWPETSEGLS